MVAVSRFEPFILISAGNKAIRKPHLLFQGGFCVSFSFSAISLLSGFYHSGLFSVMSLTLLAFSPILILALSPCCLPSSCCCHCLVLRASWLNCYGTFGGQCSSPLLVNRYPPSFTVWCAQQNRIHS